ncbi:MAG: hypothetical protein IJE49_12690 [Agathobacter sp.]|nr:hypothetical protein [Agathobacter sp.]MBQ2902683.1 hypothetical protein [Agathobacter sp.]
MKKYIYTNIVIAILMLLVGCSNENIKAKLPPVRISDIQINASFERSYTFAEAYEESDMVAHIRIGDWLGDGEYITYFEAEIIEQYKGEVINEIVLLQDGTTSETLKGYPLFTNENEMLVFLKHAVNTEYEDAYWIIGAYTTLLDVEIDKNGNQYYIDRYGILGETISTSLNIANNEELKKELYRNAIKRDSIVAEMEYEYNYIYNKTSLDELMEGFKE